MSITLMAATYERGPRNATQRAVLLALAFHVTDDALMTNPTCFPSFSTLAEQTALGVATVKRAVKELSAGDAPWLKIEPRTRANGSLTSNLYTLNAARIMADDTYPSITATLAPSITADGASITATLAPYHSDTRVVSQRAYPSITVILPDPVSYPVSYPGSEQGESAAPPAPVPPVVVRQAADRTPSGFKATNGYHPPADRPIPDDEPGMVRAAPPAVRMIWRVTAIWPREVLHDWLSEALGSAPDEVTFRRVWLLWNQRGYRQDNWEGVAEWYGQARANPNWKPPGGASAKKQPQQRGPIAQTNIPATGGVH